MSSQLLGRVVGGRVCGVCHAMRRVKGKWFAGEGSLGVSTEFAVAILQCSWLGDTQLSEE